MYLTVSEVRIRFRGSAGYDDGVRVRTILKKVRSRGVSFSYEVEEGESGRALASAETDLVCIDGDGSTRKLPDDVRELLVGAVTGLE